MHALQIQKGLKGIRHVPTSQSVFQSWRVHLEWKDIMKCSKALIVVELVAVRSEWLWDDAQAPEVVKGVELIGRRFSV